MKGASFAQLAFYRYGSIHQLYDAPRDVKAQACTFIFASWPPAKLVKYFKDGLAVIFGDADAGISDRKVQVYIFFRACGGLFFF